MTPAGVRLLLGLLTRREKRQAVGLIGMMLVMAIFDMIGIAAIMPFLAVLGDPGIIGEVPALAWLHRLAGQPEPTAFLVWLGLGAIALVLLSGLVRSLTELRIHHFTQMRVHSIGARLLEAYLRQPYEFHVMREGGALQKTILSEAEHVVRHAVFPSVVILSNGLVLVVVVGLLVAVDPVVAASAAALLVLSYGVIFLALRRAVRERGAASVIADQDRFHAVDEALQGVREIRLRGVEGVFLERFRIPSERRARTVAFSNAASNVPKYGVEAAAFAGLIALALVLMLRHGGAGSAALGTFLPLIGLYVFAGVRLLPAVQMLYRCFSTLSFADAALRNVVKDLQAGARLPAAPAEPVEPLPLKQALVLDAVGYRYPGAAAPGLDGIDVTIPAGSTIGVVGRTGAGKTTLIDLMLGLLPPTSGRLVVDGTEITPERLRAWQASVGYVPQDIFLMDASIARNIAFGRVEAEIDMDRVAAAARMARLETVIADLPEGYATRIGERGVRLSGGQRQRIGIARALYGDPGLLVFDEATSALDTATEREVMAALARLAGTRTIVMIAHRLSTVEACDRILVLDGGRLVAQGTHAELIASSPHFRAIANAA